MMPQIPLFKENTDDYAELIGKDIQETKCNSLEISDCKSASTKKGSDSSTNSSGFAKEKHKKEKNVTFQNSAEMDTKKGDSKKGLTTPIKFIDSIDDNYDINILGFSLNLKALEPARENDKMNNSFNHTDVESGFFIKLHHCPEKQNKPALKKK